MITKQQRPSHVILSAEAYRELLEKLEELEDLKLGKMAQLALNSSKCVGVEEFTAIIHNLANSN